MLITDDAMSTPQMSFIYQIGTPDIKLAKEKQKIAEDIHALNILLDASRCDKSAVQRAKLSNVLCNIINNLEYFSILTTNLEFLKGLKDV